MGGIKELGDLGVGRARNLSSLLTQLAIVHLTATYYLEFGWIVGVGGFERFLYHPCRIV